MSEEVFLKKQTTLCFNKVIVHVGSHFHPSQNALSQETIVVDQDDVHALEHGTTQDAVQNNPPLKVVKDFDPFDFEALHSGDTNLNEPKVDMTGDTNFNELEVDMTLDTNFTDSSIQNEFNVGVLSMREDKEDTEVVSDTSTQADSDRVCKIENRMIM
ncbi:hypothetical protein LXL04_019634 [Taraxacum kok-saghyz]